MAYKDYPYAAKASHRHISGPDLVKYTTYGADLLDGGGLVNNLARQGTTLSALRKLKHKNKLTEKQELTIEKKEKRLVGLQKLYALESQKLARGHEDHKKLDTVSDEFAYLTRLILYLLGPNESLIPEYLGHKIAEGVRQRLLGK